MKICNIFLLVVLCVFFSTVNGRTTRFTLKPNSKCCMFCKCPSEIVLGRNLIYLFLLQNRLCQHYAVQRHVLKGSMAALFMPWDGILTAIAENAFSTTRLAVRLAQMILAPGKLVNLHANLAKWLNGRKPASYMIGEYF